MKCITVNCDQEISVRSKLVKCERCRASINGWKRRHPSEVLKRCSDLDRYQDRMSDVKPVVLSKKLPNNVVPFKRRTAGSTQARKKVARR